MLWLCHSGINFRFVLELNSKPALHSVSSVVFFFFDLLFVILVNIVIFVILVCLLCGFFPHLLTFAGFSAQQIVYVDMYSIISDPEVRSKNRSITETKVFLRDSHSTPSYFNPSSFPLLHSKQLHRPAYLCLYMHYNIYSSKTKQKLHNKMSNQHSVPLPRMLYDKINQATNLYQK